MIATEQYIHVPIKLSENVPSLLETQVTYKFHVEWSKNIIPKLDIECYITNLTTSSENVPWWLLI